MPAAGSRSVVARILLRKAGVVLAVFVMGIGLPARAVALTLPASCSLFTDSPLAAGATVIRAVHITQMRACIADLRAQFGLSTVTWTDATIVPGTTVVKAV